MQTTVKLKMLLLATLLPIAAAAEYYPINGDKTTLENPFGEQCQATEIGIIAGNNRQIVVPDNSPLVYCDLLGNLFYAQIGQTITPVVEHSDTIFTPYCYIDFNQDGFFGVDEAVGSNFKIASSIQPGRYRVRFKLDGSDASAAGSADSLALVADAMLSIAGKEVEVYAPAIPNGQVVDKWGAQLNPLKAPYNQNFVIRLAADKAYHHNGALVKMGYNLDGDGFDEYGNPQYDEFIVEENAVYGDRYEFKAEKMRENLQIIGRMAEGELYPADNISGTLPIVSVNTENFVTIIDRVTKIPASLSVTVPKNYVTLNGKEAEAVEISDLTIRGRGNASWTWQKKPYKLKFAEKTKLMGLPKSKHFSLIPYPGFQT
ncbi:MAG: hypothetical protein NC301_06835 [Bacteroides sp.]|nr:hypothetical protein [Bacteroides sp.]MCM1378910.1 hypothetical protein [Bacteroides sp.]MCM1445526.1 hypothetical protein [Prevotella sp.]